DGARGAALRLARWSITIAVAMLLAACETAAPASPAGPGSPTPGVQGALLPDLSMPDADEHTLPASQAIRLAFETAMLQDPSSVPVELEEFDVAQDAADLESIDADVSY